MNRAESAPGISITSFILSHDALSLGKPFQVHITAEAKRNAVIGSYVVRISHPVRESDALPGFDLYTNSRA